MPRSTRNVNGLSIVVSTAGHINVTGSIWDMNDEDTVMKAMLGAFDDAKRARAEIRERRTSSGARVRTPIPQLESVDA